MKETIIKGVASSVVASVGTYLLFGGNGGTAEIQNSLMVAGAVGAGSIASDLVSDNLIEKMNLPQNIKSLEELLIRTGVCGASSSIVLTAVIGMPTSNIPKSFLLGAGSKWGGDIAYDQLLSPQHGILPMF